MVLPIAEQPIVAVCADTVVIALGEWDFAVEERSERGAYSAGQGPNR